MPTINIADPSVYTNNAGKVTDGAKVLADFGTVFNEVNAKDVRIASLESGDMTIAGQKAFSTAPILAIAADPGMPVEGMAWENSTTHLFKLFDGTSILTLANAAIKVKPKTANYTFVAADNNALFVCTSTFTLSLAPATVLGAGWYTYIANTGTGVISIVPDGTDLVDGILNFNLGPGNSFLLVCTGTTFYTVGRKAELIILQDQKAANTAGGNSTASTWTTHVLNTKVLDTAGICTLAVNQFTIPAGTYEAQANAQAYNVGFLQIKLYNITAAATSIAGDNQTSNNGGNNTAVSSLTGPLVLTTDTVFELQYWTSTATATNGLGPAINSAEIAVFATVKLRKVV